MACLGEFCALRVLLAHGQNYDEAQKESQGNCMQNKQIMYL